MGIVLQVQICFTCRYPWGCALRNTDVHIHEPTFQRYAQTSFSFPKENTPKHGFCNISHQTLITLLLITLHFLEDHCFQGFKCETCITSYNAKQTRFPFFFFFCSHVCTPLNPSVLPWEVPFFKSKVSSSQCGIVKKQKQKQKNKKTKTVHFCMCKLKLTKTILSFTVRALVKT